MVYLDPILLVDHLRLAHTPGIGKLGFPRHPHRGIETFTIVLEGTMHHKDSIGNVSAIGPGGAQWMTAGRGIFHEEMMESHGKGVEVLQLWFNLPAARKQTAPGYQGVSAQEVPQVGHVRVFAGSHEGVLGAVKGIAVEPTVLDIDLPENSLIVIPTTEGHTAAAYLMKGEGLVTNQPSLVVFSDHGDSVELKSGSGGARWIFLSAPKLNEPIMQFRSFVMNTADEIGETLKLIDAGGFGT
jgi:redox-sensitive bicupin YhaK (pirin superfamily)